MYPLLTDVEDQVAAIVAVCKKWFSGFGDRLNEEAQAIIEGKQNPTAEQSAAVENAPQQTGAYNPYAPVAEAQPAPSQAPAEPAQPPPYVQVDPNEPAPAPARVGGIAHEPAPASEPGVTQFAPPSFMPPTGGAVETPQEKVLRLQRELDQANAEAVQ